LVLQNITHTDMGEPVRKVSGRAFNRMSTCFPDPRLGSPSMTPSRSLEMSNEPAFEGLRTGLAIAVLQLLKDIT
jgi:hypothetical protein